MKCKEFLRVNGWTETQEQGSEYASFNRAVASIGIDIGCDEIVFIDESGDFLHIPQNIYALIGTLHHLRQLQPNYYWIPEAQDER